MIAKSSPPSGEKNKIIGYISCLVHVILRPVFGGRETLCSWVLTHAMAKISARFLGLVT